MKRLLVEASATVVTMFARGLVFTSSISEVAEVVKTGPLTTSATAAAEVVKTGPFTTSISEAAEVVKRVVSQFGNGPFRSLRSCSCGGCEDDSLHTLHK